MKKTFAFVIFLTQSVFCYASSSIDQSSKLDSYFGSIPEGYGQAVLIVDRADEWGSLHDMYFTVNGTKVYSNEEAYYCVINTNKKRLKVSGFLSENDSRIGYEKLEISFGNRIFLKVESDGIASYSFSFKRKSRVKKFISRYIKHPETLSFSIEPSPKEAVAKNNNNGLSFSTIKTKNEASNRYGIAVIIGNKNYSKHNRDIPDVKYAHNDADAMYQYVTQVLGYREGNIIFLKDASQADMTSAFGNKENPKAKLFSWVRPQKSDVFVYYSGHGAPGLSNGAGYLLPANSDPTTVEFNGYPLEILYKNLAQIPAKSMTVVLDACFSGASSDGTIVKNASSISLKRVETKNIIRNANVFSAAGVSEVASWDQDRQMGLFTRFFLDGVNGVADNQDFGNGDGKVSLGELKTYLEEEVSYWARRKFLRDQHPQITGDETEIMATLK